MGRKRAETTIEERKVIINLHNQCKSLSEISRIVNRPRTTIQSVVDRYGARKSLQNNSRSGRPRKINQRVGRSIIRMIKENPRISAVKIVEYLKNNLSIELSTSTVRSFLRCQGFHGRVARKKYFVSETNRKKRLQFAKDNINASPDFWNRVIFTDESKFNIFGSDGHCTVWRKKNEALKPKNLRPTVKHGGGSVLVWGCMSASGVGILHFIDGIMNHWAYIDILKRNLVPSAEKMGMKDNFIFMHDNDPKHTAHSTRMWVLYNTPKHLKTPPQSPDINPIEHLWDFLDRQIRKHHISSKESLKNALMEEWNKIPSSLTAKLVNSMPKRLDAIIKSKGHPTKY